MKNLTLLAPALVLGLSAQAAQRPEKPNVVILLADDLGWQDLKCYDIDEPNPFETPHIDKLSTQGIKFWQAYSPAPSSSPTRGSILSGKHPARLQRTHVEGGEPPLPYGKGNNTMIPPYYLGRLPLDVETIPDMIKDRGYVSGHVAKWHVVVKYGSSPTPLEHGFDWSYSDIKTQHVMKPDRLTGFTTEEKDSPYYIDKDGFPTDPANAKAIEFMETNKNKPFFLYYGTWMVHAPIQTRSKALLEKYCKKMNVPYPTNPVGWPYKGQKNPYYGAMVETLDHYIGMMMDYLNNTDDPRWPGHKLIENTYVVFTSDNGGMEGYSNEVFTDNYPLDKGKINANEGGIRVPFIVTGPNIPRGVESDVMISGYDLVPTILSWTGSKTPKDLVLDGADLSGLFAKDYKNASLVKTQDGKERDFMVHHFPHSRFHSTIRVGGYKLIVNFDPRLPRFMLYQLYDENNKRVDIEEKNNLADKMPKKVQQMNKQLFDYLEQMDASMPFYNPNAVHFKDKKTNAPEIVSASCAGNKVVAKFKENKNKVVRAFVVYTSNGGARNEEWFKVEAKISKDQVEAILPEGATHYIVSIVDDYNFIVSYPDLGYSSKRKLAFSEEALKVN